MTSLTLVRRIKARISWNAYFLRPNRALPERVSATEPSVAQPLWSAGSHPTSRRSPTSARTTVPRSVRPAVGSLPYAEACLLDEPRVAIDGSKFKAVNNREKNFTHGRLKKRKEAIEQAITRYLSDLDRADRQAEVTGVPVLAKNSQP